MIDLHSHILPAVDDGSRDVAESVAMLEMLSEQGVDVVAATPHFYADKESIETFLRRRRTAYEQLCAALPENAPRILCGAEVRYYAGISRLADLERLCIGDSRLLLLEMSMSRWTEYTVKELVELAGRSRMRLIIAHMDRYMQFQSKGTLERLYASGIKMQFNADFLIERKTRRRAVSMLKNGEIHMLGSDCHDVQWRPPQIGEAYRWMEKKLGGEFLAQFHRYGASLLGL